MIVKIVKNYRDMELDRAVSAGSMLKVNDERGQYLISLGIAEACDDNNETKSNTTPPLKSPEAYNKPETTKTMFTKEELTAMSYRELQDLARNKGLKPNQRSAKLIKDLLSLQK